jgi:hypothetical protein
MRTISAGFRDEIESSNGQDVLIIFATITHPTLDGPICVNSDITDYVYNSPTGDGTSRTYFGTGISLSFLSDDDNPPQAKVTVPNVDRRIGEAVLNADDAPQIKIELLVKSDFDNSTPRNPIGTPTPEYTAQLMFLRNVQWDAMQFTADILSYDISTEPWPAIRTTPSTTPALFR